MTDDEKAFIRAICTQPACTTSRLVYADWLDEQGRHDRAEFIRVQCELHQYPQQSAWLDNMPLESWEGDNTEGLIIACLDPVHKRHSKLCKMYVWDMARWSREFIKFVLGSYYFQELPKWQWYWSRGFVYKLEVPADDFMRYGQGAFLLQPITEVRLTDCRPRSPDWEAGDAPAVWQRRSVTMRSHPDGNRRGYGVPDEIFDLMPRRYWVQSVAMSRLPYSNTYPPDQETAYDWLSAACVKWARRKVGLPDLS